MKKKYKGVVYKRRVEKTLEQAYRELNSCQIGPDAGQVGQEAEWMMRRYELRPQAIITYDRDAWFYDAWADVRITFDRNLSCRMSDFSLTSKGTNYMLTSPVQRLMEVKTSGTYPLWLCQLLHAAGAKRIHFSKYELAYQKYIQTKKYGGDICLTVFLQKGI